MTVHIDFETRSLVDLKQVGAWVYSEHPSTEILCMKYAIDKGPIKLWLPLQPFPEFLAEEIEFGNIFEAHNAFFEKAIWQNIGQPRHDFPMVPAVQWQCTAARAAYFALPRALGNCGKALGLSTVKDDDGKKVMMQLAKPNPKTGKFLDELDNLDKYLQLYQYCETDVASERAISEALPQLPAFEKKVWLLDQIINSRGVPIDREAVSSALKILEEFQSRLKKEVLEITEGEIKTIGQRSKVIAWCGERGEKLTGYDKAQITQALSRVKNPKVKRLLEIRQALGKTSTAKYEAMRNSCGKDGRIRDVLMYHGAATGRWAGKLVQFQNLPKGNIKNMPTAVDCIKLSDPDLVEMLYGNVMNFMSSAIRGMVSAPAGKLLIAADFAAIEARVLAWLSGCELMLKQFRDGADLYVDMAAKIYGIDPAQVTSDQRQLGKAAILGAGYGMGKVKFHATCLSWGINVTEELAAAAINTYRQTYREVPNFWREMDRHSLRSTRYKDNSVYWISERAFLQWEWSEKFLSCKLPSGRSLNFYKPEIQPKSNDWGNNDALTFMGEKAGKNGGKSWQRVDTYGGKLVENITQAVARDLMAEAMLRIEAAGYEIILSVHDELIAEVREDSNLSVEAFEKLMSALPSWAAGCPVEAKGWVGKNYKK
ncbi:bifunctional 3'-5' exonuclease/DNA polymerase [uncultured Caudovirales phage]|uniref:Bifunctional 3'-5' exonuclease/DNA polymerase n=1 Tax=uncultured Caudovirales phage TaxID=2100421 RepID=A0A6J5SGV2_9CAUD|nr:bifunctional 3'-5' exonuclease/DNA polymerase [uncultured Caudovirales phage]